MAYFPYFDKCNFIRPAAAKKKIDSADPPSQARKSFPLISRSSKPRERLIGLRDEMIDTFRDPPTVRSIVRLSVSERIVQELLARDGLRATLRASASLEAVVQMALDGLGIAVMPPASSK
jgi:DNA-binding transcriptional LysR family regulator